MYAQNFGLKRRPFRANATGADVFVGPQIVIAMAGLRKSLAASDAIATVSGPVGSGKTTLVLRTLDSICTDRRIIRIARMQLQCSDILEFLLDELGIKDQPSGPIRKFSAFRRRLQELEEMDCRVFIAVEDSVRLGSENLAELEALTAADTGASDGASIVLMGDEGLVDSLAGPELARTRQRIRQHYTTTALCAAELRGYLRHSFRLSGGDFENVFEANAAPLLHHLSDGIPRVVNNLVEAAMTAAADQDLTQVSSELLAWVAENEFALNAADFDLQSQPAMLPTAAVTPVVANDPEPVTETLATLEIEPALEAVPVLEAEFVAEPEPVVVFASAEQELQEELPTVVNIPELIQDTLPDLEVLAPELAADDIPAWDRDPTLAQLRPDFAALEKAMAFAQADEPKAVVEESQPAVAKAPDIPELIPEITLDNAISQRIESNLIDEPGEVSAPAAEAGTAGASDLPTVSLPPKQSKKADSELDRIASELARAKSIEDIDERMAETFFGDELNLAASQFIKPKSSGESANDDQENVVATGQPVATGTRPSADFEVTLQAAFSPDEGGLDMSASQRLKTVRALNADLHSSLRRPDTTAANDSSTGSVESRESIEDQINTSMTQTLKALNVSPPISRNEFGDDDADDHNEEKGGFFNRFKRS